MQKTYSITAPPDSVLFLQREEVMSKITSSSGDTIYVLHVFRKSVEADPWDFYEIHQIRVNLGEYTRTIDNLPEVILTFPLGNGTSWDGNKYNTDDSELYTTENVNQEFVTDTCVFFPTITIQKSNETDNLIFRDVSYEVFGEHIGPVYGLQEQLNYCDEVDCFGNFEIEDGFIELRKLVSYGSS